MLRALLVAAVCVLASIGAACGPGLETYRVNDGVQLHRYEFATSNVYVVEAEEGAVIIDAGAPGKTKKILKAMKKSGVDPVKVRALVVTHAHADHTGSARELAHEIGIPIIIQKADAERAKTGRNPRLPPRNVTAFFIKWFLKKRYPAYEADIAYENCVRLSDYGVPGYVFSTPGHTPGSSIVMLPEGHVVVGDLLAGGFWGGAFGAKNPESHYFQEDVETVRGTIEWLTRSGQFTDLYPGHGGPLKIERVKAELERGEFGKPVKKGDVKVVCPLPEDPVKRYDTSY